MATIARKSAAPAAAKGKFDARVRRHRRRQRQLRGWPRRCSAAGRATRFWFWRKASQLGGTTRKAAFWYWVPNNAAMRAAGTKDPKKDCIRYMARLSRPEVYDADASDDSA